MQRRHFLMNPGVAGLVGLGLTQAMAQALHGDFVRSELTKWARVARDAKVPIYS